MGVPKYFRWISERYPLIRQKLDGEGSVPEIDNFYLDVNGIIHHCTHPEGLDRDLTKDEILSGVFIAIDKLFQIAKPKKFFFIAVDGVAPRAKMNQQRSRRTRAGAERVRALAAGAPGSQFDSNCITPGTEFMMDLERHLRFFIKRKVEEDVFWKRTKVIFSGHSVPGEGEHKIIEFIRKRRAEEGYDPNEVHCWQGLDADLIFLALSTHEPHTMILRSEVKFRRPREGAIDFDKRIESIEVAKGFEILHVSLLREYIDLEFQDLKDNLPFQYDLERIIDDYVFLGFFVGNDFLPKLPTLNIKSGALQMLFEAYRELLPTWDSYLTCPMDGFGRKLSEHGYVGPSGGVKRERGASYTGGLCLGYLEQLLSRVGDEETDSVVTMLDDWKRIKTRKERGEVDQLPSVFPPFDASEASGGVLESFRRWYYGYRLGVPISPPLPGQERLSSFHSSPSSINSIVRDYVEGLLWVRCYYTGGVGSWSWYYPHHYAPFASDFVGLSSLDAFERGFDESLPFSPLMQLLSVLPIHSRALLPQPLGDIMVSEEFKNFYPNDVAVDMEGKENDWEGIVLLPFLDIARLEAMAQKAFERLKGAEAERNAFGTSLMVANMGSRQEKEIEVSTTCRNLLSSFKTRSLICQEVGVSEIFGSAAACQYSGTLLEGVQRGLIAPPGIPSLLHIRFRASLKDAKVNVFGGISKQPSMCLSIRAREAPTRDIPSSAPEIAERFLDTIFYVDYPYLRPAKLVAVLDGFVRAKIINNGGKIFVKTQAMEDGDRHQYKKHLDGIESKLRTSSAIELDDCRALLIVKRAVGVQVDDHGRRNIVFAEAPFTGEDDDIDAIPLPLVCLAMLRPDKRLLQKDDAMSMEQSLPVGESVIVTSKEHVGSKGVVVGHNKDKAVVRVLRPSWTHECPSLKGISTNGGMLPLGAAAKLCNTSPFLFSLILGQVFVRTISGTADIGLRLKFDKRGLAVLGMARKDNRGWEVSNEVIELFAEYRRRFPTVIRALEKAGGFEEIKRLHVSNLFVDNAIQNFESLCSWLEGLPVRSAPLVHFGNVMLPPSGLAKISNVLEQREEEEFAVIREYGERPVCDIVVDRKMCIAPLDHLPLLPHTATTAVDGSGNGVRNAEGSVLPHGFAIGDRVVFRSGSGRIPFGALGYVVGGGGGKLFILLDHPCMAGTSLSGWVPKGRGVTATPNSIVNISPFLSSKRGVKCDMSRYTRLQGSTHGSSVESTGKQAESMAASAFTVSPRGIESGVSAMKKTEEKVTNGNRHALSSNCVAMEQSIDNLPDPSDPSWDPNQYWDMLVQLHTCKISQRTNSSVEAPTERKRNSSRSGKKLNSREVRTALGQ